MHPSNRGVRFLSPWNSIRSPLAFLLSFNFELVSSQGGSHTVHAVRRYLASCGDKSFPWYTRNVLNTPSPAQPYPSSARTQLPSVSEGMGSHSPPGERQARLSGGERANHGAKRSCPSARRDFPQKPCNLRNFTLY